MVSIRQVHQRSFSSFEHWLGAMSMPEHICDALTLASKKMTDADQDCQVAGREMVEILNELHMDEQTLCAALVLPYCQLVELSSEKIEEVFGQSTAQLILGMQKMDAIRTLQHSRKSAANEAQIDNLRRMLLAMVEDVRAVVLKLAERICSLRQVKDADEETRVLIAKECSTIYAPLANRLGIGQLKWELEDLAFRYLHPQTYKKIAKWLDEKRQDREGYITQFVDNLNRELKQEGVRAEVYGRPKHIFSIYKKMQKKQLAFEELFDIRAVRIVTERLQDCYGALGVVHANFKHVRSEFDDYIATPKPNGYQSIHTVVMGPQNRTVEIQIRTLQMHQDAELGVAAHWKYKEGSAGGRSGYEEKINWLRKILQWQEEISESGDLVEELRSQVFDDRVYVFTPKGDVVDMPLGSTPLDFAYYIHSNVGHRCIGAKVFGRIVPFTHQLQTGDQVEVLTGKAESPSRDWMNPQLGYIHSSRARAKIQTWFKKQDRDKNLQAGRELLEKELNRHHLTIKDAMQAPEKFNLKDIDDLYVAIGGGDVGLFQVINFLQPRNKPDLAKDPKLKKPNKMTGKDAVVVVGVGNLMSQIAKCCQPVPGDPILGFITQGRGVSVHREDCEQLQHLLETHPERAIEVSWAAEDKRAFQAKLLIRCQDREGMVRDLTTMLANDKIALLGINSQVQTKQQLTLVELSVEVRDLDCLSSLINKLKQITGVLSVERH